jgi:sugar (pentulose or hexulose) kinase
MTVLLGVDCGTESVRVLAVDREGREVGACRIPHATVHGPGGRAEQAPDAWWDGLVTAIRALLADELRADDVAAIGVTGTSSTVVFADAAGQALRPALLWMDVRAVREAGVIQATGHPALAVAPSGVSAEWGPPKVLWVATHEPELYARTGVICEAPDWLRWRLTGTSSLSLPAATTAWYYDGARRAWPSDLYAQAGCADLTNKLPATVPAHGEVTGSLTPEAARALGLSPGIPVVCGGIDSVSAMLGLGATEPGLAALITGSSNVILTLTAQPFSAPGAWGGYPNAAVSGLHLAVALHTAGAALAWLTRDLLGRDGEGSEDLAEEASRLPPGADGLLFLPDFQGNRTPYNDARMRGALWGLAFHHRPAHLYRAALEGIAFSSRQALEGLLAGGAAIDELRACGGATRHRDSLQLYADVLGRPIRVSTQPDGSALGAAMAAAAGAGVTGSLREAVERMSRLSEVCLPRAATRDAYDGLYDLFRRTYPALMPLMHDRAALTSALHPTMARTHP